MGMGRISVGGPGSCMVYSFCTKSSCTFDPITVVALTLQGNPHDQGLSVFLMSLRAQRGNLVAVATMVPRHMLNLNEIATSLRSSQ